MIKRLFIKRSASANVFFVLFLFIFVIVTTLTVEWYRIYTLKEYVDTEMSRAVNIAVDIAMLDEFRMEHISKMDKAVAKSEFKSYLSTEMKLNSSNERVQNGKFIYKIIINKEVLEESPAKYEINGMIRTKPVLLGNLININIDIPFKQTSRNQRFE
jgi:hypothetical protein